MSGEPHYLSLRDLAYWQSRPQHRSPPGPRPTLGDLQRATSWVWLWCERCQHKAPAAIVPFMIRWDAGVSSDKLRQCARCSTCGNKGATIQHPGWGGNSIGFLPFPAAGAVCDAVTRRHAKH
jgi:hypothetical protein